MFTISKTSQALVGFLLGAFCLAAHAQQQYSGWLKDYSGMESFQDSQANTVQRYANPKLTPQNYKAVIVEKLVLYPAPQPSDKVSEGTLRDIASYADRKLRDTLAPNVKIVDQPGPGVARLRAAITGSAVQDASLKAYQYIPIAFVLTTAKRAASGTPKQVKLMIEAELTDSVTGERLLTAVREGEGENLEGERVTAKSMQPLLDSWMTGAAAEVPNFIAPK